MHRLPLFALAAAATLLPASTIAGPAASGVFHANPAGACQAALPAFEGLIRKRPLATQNEGTSSAYVSCAMHSAGGVTDVLLYVAGMDATPRMVSCTAVAGFNTGSVQYLTKTTTVTNAAQSVLQWSNTEFPQTDLGSRFSVSCLLSPGTGVNDYSLVWEDY